MQKITGIARPASHWLHSRKTAISTVRSPSVNIQPAPTTACRHFKNAAISSSPESSSTTPKSTVKKRATAWGFHIDRTPAAMRSTPETIQRTRRNSPLFFIFHPSHHPSVSDFRLVIRPITANHLSILLSIPYIAQKTKVFEATGPKCRPPDAAFHPDRAFIIRIIDEKP